MWGRSPEKQIPWRAARHGHGRMGLRGARQLSVLLPGGYFPCPEQSGRAKGCRLLQRAPLSGLERKAVWASLITPLRARVLITRLAGDVAAAACVRAALSCGTRCTATSHSQFWQYCSSSFEASQAVCSRPPLGSSRRTAPRSRVSAFVTLSSSGFSWRWCSLSRKISRLLDIHRGNMYSKRQRPAGEDRQSTH